MVRGRSKPFAVFGPSLIVLTKVELMFTVAVL